MNRAIVGSIAALAFAFLMSAGPACAQATRTWVSGVGDDVNPCSRTAPCKTFAGAISKTAANGEINCLDPGGFGGFTITKGMTIDCSGTFGSVLVANTVGITVNPPANANVIIRGIVIQGNATGTSGIRYVGVGKSLHIENVKIQGFTTFGVEFVPGSNADLYMRNVQIDDVGQAGVRIAPNAGFNTEASIETSQFDNTGLAGVKVEDRGFATVYKSTAARASDGFLVATTATNGTITIYDSVASGNFGSGLHTTGPNAAIFMSNVVIAHNQTADITGNVQTWQNNFAISNAGSNPTTGNLTPK